jgi:peptidoglycan/LPS O-acetylase OafA/YrhL
MAEVPLRFLGLDVPETRTTIEVFFLRMSNLPTPHAQERPNAERIGNFDFLRLLFSLSVVYMHSVRLLDGDNHREFVQRIFGIEAAMGYGSGDLAVDGFLAMSGYFVAGTWRRSGGCLNYFRNRALRIYPAFVVASLLSQITSIFVSDRGRMAWLHEISLKTRFLELLFLAFPTAHFPFHVGALHAQDFPPVNAPLWVIAHEARCYILAALVGIMGMKFGSKWWIRGWSLVLLGSLVLIATGLEIPRFPGYSFVVGWQTYLLRYVACFATGALFRSFQDRILRLQWTIPVTAAILAVCLVHEVWLPLAIPTILAVMVLQIGTSPVLSRVLPRLPIDLSYGIFLYAWPIQILLMHAFPGIGLLLLFPLSTVIAAGCSWASLIYVERPFLRWKKARQAPVRAL